MEVIDLPFIKFKDNLAYMEILSDPRTQAIINEESARWAKLQAGIQQEKQSWQELLDACDKEYFKKPHCKEDELEIRFKDHGYKELRRGKQVWPAVYSYKKTKDNLFLVEDVQYVGSEIMKLTSEKEGWSIQNVGQAFVLNHGKIYIQSCKSVQRYYEIDEVDKGERKTIIHSTTKSQTLSPLEFAAGKLWFTQASQRHISLWFWSPATNLKRKVVEDDKNFLGFAYPYWHTDKEIYNVRTGKQIHFAKDHCIVEICTFKDGILITYLTKQIITLSYLKDGHESFLFTPSSAGKLIHVASDKEDEAHLIWFSSTQLPYKLRIKNGKLMDTEKFHDVGLDAAYGLFEREGYHIPVTTVCKRGGKPKGLIAYVYGHYHIPTPTHLVPRWWAFLKKGYALSFIGVRGGGDDGIAGWDAARGNNRSVGLLDYISAIGRLQVSYGIPAKKTILYGRSAGGFHVANAAQQISNSKTLCGAVWAEAPYVDVLKGCINYDIPVTPFERDEFFVGESFEGFHAAVKLDPVMTVPMKPKGGGVTILATDGLYDTEVMYWEVLKWCYLLRKKGWNKVACRLDPSTGHFMIGGHTNEKRAEDCAFLEASIGLN